MNRLTKIYEIHNNKPISYKADVSGYPDMMGYEYKQAEMDIVNKLGELEDLLEKYKINSIEELELIIGRNLLESNKLFSIPIEDIQENKIYKNIEEEYGIDLIKAVELCKQVNSRKVVYIKENWGIDTLKILDELDIELFSHRLYKNVRGMYVSLDLYEYGKTWALTREELEND